MLISDYMTLGMIPVGIVLTLFHALPLTITDSVLGAVLGYLLLWLIARLFYLVRRIEALGEGDLDLLAMIGAFTGLWGAWLTLFIGAFLGSLAGIALIFKYKKMHSIKLAFGPWLAIAAIMYVFLQDYLKFILMHH